MPEKADVLIDALAPNAEDRYRLSPTWEAKVFAVPRR